MKIVAIMNQKGGVGKTTVSVNIAAGLALQNYNVLLLDADLQGNATTSLGLQPKIKDDTALDLFAILTNQCTYADALLQKEIITAKAKKTLDIIPASIALSGFDQLVRALPHKQLLMKQMLSNIKGYDYIVIDCPPSLGLLTINALVAAHELLIPVQPEFFGLQGLSQILDTVTVLQESINPHLILSGIVCSRYNRRRIHQEVEHCLRDRFGSHVFATRIHENIALAEAPSFGKTIFEYDHQSTGAYDFELLCKEFLNKQHGMQKSPSIKEKVQPAKSL